MNPDPSGRLYVVTERWETAVEIEVRAGSKAEAKQIARDRDLEDDHPGIIDGARFALLPIRDRDVRRAE